MIVKRFYSLLDSRKSSTKTLSVRDPPPPQHCSPHFDVIELQTDHCVCLLQFTALLYVEPDIPLRSYTSRLERCLQQHTAIRHIRARLLHSQSLTATLNACRTALHAVDEADSTVSALLRSSAEPRVCIRRLHQQRDCMATACAGVFHDPEVQAVQQRIAQTLDALMQDCIAADAVVQHLQLTCSQLQVADDASGNYDHPALTQATLLRATQSLQGFVVHYLAALREIHESQHATALATTARLVRGLTGDIALCLTPWAPLHIQVRQLLRTLRNGTIRCSTWMDETLLGLHAGTIAGICGREDSAYAVSRLWNMCWRCLTAVALRIVDRVCSHACIEAVHTSLPSYHPTSVVTSVVAYGRLDVLVQSPLPVRGRGRQPILTDTEAISLPRTEQARQWMSSMLAVHAACTDLLACSEFSWVGAERSLESAVRRAHTALHTLEEHKEVHSGAAGAQRSIVVHCDFLLAVSVSGYECWYDVAHG